MQSSLEPFSWDEPALAILKRLLARAKTQADGWAWLAAELYVEAYAFALDNRAQAAVHHVQFGSKVTDESLDRLHPTHATVQLTIGNNGVHC